MNSRTLQAVLLAVVALPGIIVALLTGLSGVSALLGGDHPLILAPVPRNVAEAAVISERGYMIRLVHDRGARIDPDILRRLRCIAQARNDRGTIGYLAQLDSNPLNCEGVVVPY